MKRLQAQPDTLFRDQLGVCLVHKEAVLDALHTGLDRHFDRFRRESVRGDVGPPIFGNFDSRPQFGQGEGGYVERAVGRRHAAARRQLQQHGPLHELLARPQTHLVGAVHDDAAAVCLHGGEQAWLPRQVAHLAEIPMPAGHGDHGAGRIDARSLDDATVYRALEAERRAAHVTDGGKAAHQCISRLVAGREIGESDVIHRLCRGGRNQHGVPMRIYQPRH